MTDDKRQTSNDHNSSPWANGSGELITGFFLRKTRQTSWGKEIKCEACWVFFHFSATKIIKLNNSGARKLLSYLSHDAKFILNCTKVLSSFMQRYNGCLLGKDLKFTDITKSVDHNGLLILMYGVISLPDPTLCAKHFIAFSQSFDSNEC